MDPYAKVSHCRWCWCKLVGDLQLTIDGVVVCQECAAAVSKIASEDDQREYERG